MDQIAGAARGRRSRPRVGWLLVAALALPGCQRSEAPVADVDAAPSAPAEPAKPAEPPWRTLPVLAEHLGPAVAIAPIFEAVDDLHGEAMVVAVVARPGASPPAVIERWRLQSGGPKAIFAPVGEGEPVLRLRADEPPAPDRIDALRRFAATPGTAVIRPRGLGGSPEALLDGLAQALREADDPKAPPEVLARAIATMIRGLDDPLIFEDDAIPAVIPLFAAGAPAVAISRPVGARRHHVETEGANPAALELTRLADGWVLTEVKPLSTPPPTPTPATP